MSSTTNKMQFCSLPGEQCDLSTSAVAATAVATIFPWWHRSKWHSCFCCCCFFFRGKCFKVMVMVMVAMARANYRHYRRRLCVAIFDDPPPPPPPHPLYNDICKRKRKTHIRECGGRDNHHYHHTIEPVSGNSSSITVW